MHRAQNIFHTWYTSFLDIFFPESCLGCGKSRTTLCQVCYEQLPSSDTGPLPWTHSLVSYKHPLVRKSIWKLKYNHTYSIARTYGRYLYDLILSDVSEQAYFENAPIYLIPIPLSKKRLKERGYNQSALLVKAICAYDTEHLFKDGSMYLKRLDTESRQSHTKNKSARLQNIIGSFYVSKELPSPARLILIDDVVTTGATLKEAKKALVDAGARKVSAYAIAH